MFQQTMLINITTVTFYFCAIGVKVQWYLLIGFWWSI